MKWRMESTSGLVPSKTLSSIYLCKKVLSILDNERTAVEFDTIISEV